MQDPRKLLDLSGLTQLLGSFADDACLSEGEDAAEGEGPSGQDQGSEGEDWTEL